MKIVLSFCLLMALTCSAFDPRGFCEWRLGMSKPQVMDLIKKRDLSHTIDNESWYKISIKPKEGDIDSVICKDSKHKVSEIRLAFISNTVTEVTILSPKIKIYRNVSENTIPQIDYKNTSFLDLSDQVDWLESVNLYLSMRHGPRIINKMIDLSGITDCAGLGSVNFGFWNIEKHNLCISIACRIIDENSNRCGLVEIRDAPEFTKFCLEKSNL